VPNRQTIYQDGGNGAVRGGGIGIICPGGIPPRGGARIGLLFLSDGKSRPSDLTTSSKAMTLARCGVRPCPDLSGIFFVPLQPSPMIPIRGHSEADVPVHPGQFEKRRWRGLVLRGYRRGKSPPRASGRFHETSDGWAWTYIAFGCASVRVGATGQSTRQPALASTAIKIPPRKLAAPVPAMRDKGHEIFRHHLSAAMAPPRLPGARGPSMCAGFPCRRSDDRLVQAITEGRSGTAMPTCFQTCLRR